MQTQTTQTTTTTKNDLWTVDASHSHAGFSVRHLMVSNVRGEFQKLSGTVRYDAARPENTKIDVTIEVASINTREPKRDDHLRSPDFFDVEKFPAITFASKSTKRTDDGFAVTGDLTIHGVTREVVLAVDELTPEQKDPWGGTRIGASAKTKIKRSDFGMTWNAALEAGGFVVGDEIKIVLEVELIKAVG
jgi:polyisoprenoid-binding protein YceI